MKQTLFFIVVSIFILSFNCSSDIFNDGINNSNENIEDTLTTNNTIIIKLVEEGEVGRYSSLCGHPDGGGYNKFISYYDEINGDLKFAKSIDNGETWTISTIDSTNDVGKHTSMICQMYNRYVSITYYDETNKDLKSAVSTDYGENWTINTVDATGDVGTFSSTAISGIELPYYIFVSYIDSTNNALKVAKLTNFISWDTPVTVVSSGVGDNPTSIIANDIENSIYMSYYNYISSDLNFIKSIDRGSSWENPVTVDSFGTVGEYSTIAVNKTNGNIYIAYEYRNDNDLKFAKSIDGGDNWNTNVIDFASVGAGPAITVHPSTGNIFVGYFSRTSSEGFKIAKSLDSGSAWANYFINPHAIYEYDDRTTIISDSCDGKNQISFSHYGVTSFKRGLLFIRIIESEW